MKESTLLVELQARGLIAQLTAQEELVEHLNEKGKSIYCGFDPTSDSLHIGNLVPIIALRRFQLAGHRPIALVGGGTGLIGDPSGKNQERTLNSLDVVTEWSERIKDQVSPFLDFGGSRGAKVVNNFSWLGSMTQVDFLREVGKHFSVNAMIQKESVKQRINREGEGISFTEFSYMILQALDFVELYKREGCTLQLGGSDQWGNITAGIDLGRRNGCGSLFGITLPLVTKSDGAKFGKTEEGTVWLDSNKTSPYKFYQFWLGVADADVYQFLRYFTFFSVSEIDQIQQNDEVRSGKPEAQSVLAAEVTRIVHGEEGLRSARRISEALFGADIQSLSINDFEQLKLDGAPSFKVSHGLQILELLVEVGLAGSKRNAREFILGGGVKVNNEVIADTAFSLAESHLCFGRYALVRRGKKNYVLVDVV